MLFHLAENFTDPLTSALVLWVNNLVSKATQRDGKKVGLESSSLSLCSLVYFTAPCFFQILIYLTSVITALFLIILPNLCLALDKWLEREGGCREDEILADGVTIHLTNASKPLAFSFPMEFPHQMFHSKPM